MRSRNGAEDPWSEEEEEGGRGLPEFLFDPLGVARRRWVAMLACVLVGGVATVFVYATYTPTYVAQATVLITSQQIPEEFVRSTVREDSLSNVNAMLGTVLSQENLSRLIDSKGLFSDAPPDTPRISLVNRVRKRTHIDAEPGQSRRSSALVYGISYESPDRAEAAEVANALAGLFVEASIERRNIQARRTTEFLQHELERDEAALREHSQRLSEFRREHRGQLPGELETNLRKLDALVARRDALANQIAERENRIHDLSSRHERLLSEDEVLLDELRRQLARESAANTDEHPNVIALRDRIDRLEESIAQGGASQRLEPEARRSIELERREIERQRAQLADTEAAIDEMNARIDRTPAIAEEHSRLEQKEQVLREEYLDSLRKVEEARLAESLEAAQQGGQVSVLDVAQPPASPKRPAWLLAFAGLVGTLGLAVAAAVGLELLDPVVVAARQLESLSEMPVLGSFPRVA